MRYWLDWDDRVSEVDEEWLRFATENDAPSLTREAVRGRSLYSFIGDATTSYLWKELLTRVRAGATLDFVVRCDSPDRIRLLRVQASAGKDARVAFSTEVLRSDARSPVAVPPAHEQKGPLTLCSWCQRVRMPSSEWVDLEKGIARLELFGGDSPALMSHGVCPDCYARALEDVPMQSLGGW